MCGHVPKNSLSLYHKWGIEPHDGTHNLAPMPRFCPAAIGARSFPAKGAHLLELKMMDLSQVTLKDTVVSARGARSCQVRGQDGSKISFVLGTSSDPVTTPFGASSFNEAEATRKTLEFTLSPEAEQTWHEFDRWAIDYFVKHSFRLFKRIMTEDQVREAYRSPMTKKGDYKATLRTKINVGGSHSVRVWNMNRQRIELPDDLRDTEMVAKVLLSHSWQMSKEIGMVFQVTDLQVRSSSAECPFDDSGAFEDPGAFGGA